MKMIGLLGGMSWESTVEYYRLLNKSVRARLGGQHSARIVLFSVDFEEISEAQHRGDWGHATSLLADGARRLERAGAEFCLLCTNTMHKVFPEVQASVSIPFIHLADATGMCLKDAGLSRAGLLGTRFTMEEDFYRERIEMVSGTSVIVPEERDRENLHRIIYHELCQGVISATSRNEMAEITARLQERGADAIILGCTELGLLLHDGETTLPVLDTTKIHVEAAMVQAFSG